MDIEGMLSEHGDTARIRALEEEVKALKRELKVKGDELDKANASAARILDTDPLTGLVNRKYFVEMLTKAISFAKRSNMSLSVMMCDLDSFKFIVDTYGHDIADNVMVSFARILESSTRNEDTVARVGGDEFMLLLPNTSAEHALACADRMVETMTKLKVEGVSARLSASFGVTSIREGDTEEALLKRADDALFKAKGSGPRKAAAV